MKKRESRHLLQITALVLVLALLAGTLFLLPGRAADTSSFGKLTDSYTAHSGSFTLDGNSRFFIPSGTAAPAQELVELVQLAQQQFAAAGFPGEAVMPIVWGKADLVQSGDIMVVLDTASGVGAEGYRLEVGAYASVTAQDARGMLYGLNALLKHFMTGGENRIQGFTSTDVPDTAERTVMLECGRKYYSKDWICNFVRQMAWMGYNTIQLHFSEDGGFRFDLWDPTFYTDSYRPANDFTWLCGSETADYLHLMSRDEVVLTDPCKDQYLTTAEVVEILQTCGRYQIDVIPSFDSPGHMDYLTWKYEQNYLKDNGYTFTSTYFNKTYAAKDIQGVINYTGKKASETWTMGRPYFTSFDLNNEQAYAFVMELYKDMADFFKTYAGSRDFSICADEVSFASSASSSFRNPAASQKPQPTYNWSFPDFVEYVTDLNTFLNGKGYTVRLYNDYIGNNTNAANYGLSAFPDNIEIMYWSSDFNAGTGGTTTSKPVTYFAGTVPVYNCLSNYTYYAQAWKTSPYVAHPDCHCPQNTWWTMNYATEDLIYRDWYPCDFTARGHYPPSRDVILPAGQVAGGYFLIWSDNYAYATESEIWNGFYSCAGGHLKVDLIDRMWSNNIKMLNWDVDSTVSFADFAAVRDKISSFPGIGKSGGLETCSAAPVYAAATEPMALADRDTLAAALAGKISPEFYTPASYQPYETAYAAVQAAYDDPRTTAQQMRDVIGALERAKTGLRPLTVTVTVEHQLPTGNVTQTYTLDAGATTCEIYLAGFAGHTFHSTDVGTFHPLISGSASGYLTLPATGDLTVHVKYSSSVDDSHLQTLIRNAITQPSEGFYTADSWAAYEKALEDAKNFSIAPGTLQYQIDELVDALEKAHAALVTTAPGASTLQVETLRDSFRSGKSVIFYVTTGPDVAALTVSCDGQPVVLTSCDGEVQTLDGQTVKRWMVAFTAPAPGSYTYTLTDGTNERTIPVTVD